MLENDAKSFYDHSDITKDRSPIFLAIRNENEEILKSIFLSLNAEEQLSIRTSQGLTPVMFAAKNRYHTSLNSLIELNSTSINQEDNNCNTILMHVL